MQNILSELIVKAEGGGLRNENFRAVFELKRQIANANDPDAIEAAVVATERLQATKTPFANYLQLQILEALQSWLFFAWAALNSKRNASSKKLKDLAPEQQFQIVSVFLFKRLVDLVVASLGSRRSTLKAQALRARIFEIFQMSLPFQHHPEFMVVAEMVLTSAQSGRPDKVAALSVIAAYFDINDKEIPGRRLVSKLRKLAKSDPTESAASGAVQALLSCGVIDCWAATRMRDSWEDLFMF